MTAAAGGVAKIRAAGGGLYGETTLQIRPVATISGLDFPGNARVRSTMRFEFTSPLEAYPATYIWRAYPRQQQSYYTAFFWGNNGAFSHHTLTMVSILTQTGKPHIKISGKSRLRPGGLC